MLSRGNSMVWMDGKDQETGSWDQTPMNQGGAMENKQDIEMDALSTFKSMLEAEDEDWYLASSHSNGNSSFNPSNNNNIQGHHHDIRELTFSTNFTDPEQNLILHQVDSSASCSPSPASVFNNLDPSQVHHYFLQPATKTSLLTGLNPMSGSELDNTNFDLGCENFLENQALSAFGRGGIGVLSGGFNDLTPQTQMGALNLNSGPQFPTPHLLQMPQNGGFGSFGLGEASGNMSSLFLNRSKLLQPLDNFASVGAQPTLFQKRAALRKNLANNGSNLGVLGGEIGQSSASIEGFSKKKEVGEVSGAKRKNSFGGDFEDVSLDTSNLNYDSDELTENTTNNNKLGEDGHKNGGTSSNANSTVTAEDLKGKKKGLPAKNLMAERRRRKKLNDRLYMLRSVVPRISKMDRASILGDAIEYLKELLQKINYLQNELESTPPTSTLTTPTTTFYPLTPTASALPGRIKEQLCPSAFASPLSSPTTGQPARIEVRVREGRAVNIHMFCSHRPGLLLSTMRVLDGLGLDIQQAVISCFNGFALDIFRAEQCKEGQELPPEHIKAALLDSAGFQGMV